MNVFSNGFQMCEAGQINAENYVFHTGFTTTDDRMWVGNWKIAPKPYLHAEQKSAKSSRFFSLFGPFLYSKIGKKKGQNAKSSRFCPPTGKPPPPANPQASPTRPMKQTPVGFVACKPALHAQHKSANKKELSAQPQQLGNTLCCVCLALLTAQHKLSRSFCGRRASRKFAGLASGTHKGMGDAFHQG